MITFSGYLPDRTCHECGIILPAPYFIGSIKINRRGARVAEFAETCFKCDKSRRFEKDLRGLRLTDTYTNDNGRIVGWRQRTRAGAFGSELPISLMQIRRANGVLRPQPRLDRKRPSEIVAREILRNHTPIRDHRRSFKRSDVQKAAQLQDNRCFGCRRPFTEADPPVGDHHKPWSRRHPTTFGNCRAYHASCNASKSDLDYEEWRKIQAVKSGGLPLFDRSHR